MEDSEKKDDEVFILLAVSFELNVALKDIDHAANIRRVIIPLTIIEKFRR